MKKGDKPYRFSWIWIYADRDGMCGSCHSEIVAGDKVHFRPQAFGLSSVVFCRDCGIAKNCNMRLSNMRE